MPIPHEINAAAGQPGTTYRLSVDARDPHFVVNSAPGRIADVTLIGGPALRHARIDHEGVKAPYATLSVGASLEVAEDVRGRMFSLQDPSESSSVFVAIRKA